MEKLTTQEEEAMKIVWQKGEGSVKDFLELYKPPVPPYTTLASTLKNLEKKKYLIASLVGNTYLYKASLTEQAYKNHFMNRLVKNYFSDSYKELVNFFVDQKKLSPDELRDILKMIDSGKDKPL